MMYVDSDGPSHSVILAWCIWIINDESCDFESRLWWGVLDTTLSDKVCQWLVACWWFSPGTPVYSTNKTDHHDITEILLKVPLNTITPNPINVMFYDMSCLSWRSVVFAARNRRMPHITNTFCPILFENSRSSNRIPGVIVWALV